MKVLYIFFIFLILILSVTSGYSMLYVKEDFENYSNGDDIIKKKALWVLTEPQDNPVGGGIASSKQAHSGKISALFDKAQCMGFPYADLKLPNTYVISTWFYHDSKQMPPPDAFVIIIPDSFPGGGNSWMGIGTRTQAIVLENYAYRDKTGTSLYEDTKVPRRTDWVQFVFSVKPDSTDFYVDGKKVYTAKIASSRFLGYQMSRTPPWGTQTGEVFIDDVVFADKIEEIPTSKAVDSLSKLVTTWSKLKKTDI